jgi:hypothetical protein
MKSIGKVAAVLVALAVAGCTVQREPTPTSASRADGTVMLAYTTYWWQKAEIDGAAATAKAREICIGWGYSGARAFGSSLERCTSRNSCEFVQITLPYQCTGAPR